jgi:4-amino-4-deoxychorismate lyase
MDSQTTEFNNMTWLKTSSRDVYDAARHRMSKRLPELGIDEVDQTYHEVLLRKESGEVVEGSISNVYFWRNATWVTPFVGRGCGGGLKGTARLWGLQKGICKEGKIEVGTVKLFEQVWVSNGVRGFLPGIILCTGS